MTDARREPVTRQDLEEMAKAFGYDMRWAGFCVKVKALADRLAASEKALKQTKANFEQCEREMYLKQDTLVQRLAEVERERDAFKQAAIDKSKQRVAWEETIDLLQDKLTDAQATIAQLEKSLDAAYQLHTQDDTRIFTLEQQVARLRDDMQHIAEYWNGNENERAMSDACHHVVEVAQQALRETGA